MKVISSKDAQNAFGSFLDAAQSEPVIITRRKQPITVTFSMENLSGLLDFADSMKRQIEAGIKAGLADAEAGRGKELTDEYIEELATKAQNRINNKKTL